MPKHPDTINAKRIFQYMPFNMKKKINTIQDALAYQVKGLVYAETKVRSEFEACRAQITSADVKTEVQKYINSTDNKLLKLERTFNYLMQEFASRKNAVITKLIEETQYMLSNTPSAHLKDILMVACIQNINAYKIASYRSAYLFAVELELDPVADLLQQILDWEVETGKTLGSLAIHEFNKIDTTLKAEEG